MKNKKKSFRSLLRTVNISFLRSLEALTQLLQRGFHRNKGRGFRETDDTVLQRLERASGIGGCTAVSKNGSRQRSDSVGATKQWPTPTGLNLHGPSTRNRLQSSSQRA